MIRKLLALTALLTLTLAACIPIQDAVQDAVASIGRGDDGALLILTGDSVTFDPVDGTALGVVLFVGGAPIGGLPGGCESLSHGFYCELGDVSLPVTLLVEGSDLSANVSYRRDGSDRWFFFYVRPE